MSTQVESPSAVVLIKNVDEFLKVLQEELLNIKEFMHPETNHFASPQLGGGGRNE